MHRTFLAALILIGFAVPADAQEACKMEQLKTPKLTLADMYARAEAKAKAWQADAVPVTLGNTSMGPLDEQGRSEAWNMTFFSPSAKANVSITTFRGMFNCFARPGEAGRIPDLNRNSSSMERSCTVWPRSMAAR